MLKVLLYMPPSMSRTILTGLVAATALAAALVPSPTKAASTVWWNPRLIICDRAGCHEAPDPYWDGPYRVHRPCREWRQCYWRQHWWVAPRYGAFL